MVGGIERNPSGTMVQATSVYGPEKGEEVRKECQACRNRKYVDGSNDPGVSFKAPTHISSEAAAAQVSAHEYEHVKNAYGEAFQNGKKVISATVQIHMATCPECGKVYVAGGTTKTVTADKGRNEYDRLQGIGRTLDRRA